MYYRVIVFIDGKQIGVMRFDTIYEASRFATWMQDQYAGCYIEINSVKEVEV